MAGWASRYTIERGAVKRAGCRPLLLLVSLRRFGVPAACRKDVAHYLSVTMEKSGPADGSFDLSLIVTSFR